MRFTDYIWDFDGMLFNTYPRMCAAFREALARQGCRRPEDEVMAAIKGSVREATAAYAARFGLDRDRLTADYKTAEHAMPPETIVPYDGAEAFLRAVVARGGRHFLYTHRDFSALDALARWHMDDCFSGAVTAEDGFPVKPAPDALLHLIRTYAIDPGRAVMLGDRDIDIEAAKRAGIAGCLVDPGRFYDGYDAPLRCRSIDGLYALMAL
ncbi:MAG: HAD-IA family hydrolase [Clostridia bacterium]|nr:HAD-IA family hydrolase [Clostridia bacterium]